MLNQSSQQPPQHSPQSRQLQADIIKCVKGPKSTKIVHEPLKPFIYYDHQGKLRGVYIPELPVDGDHILQELNDVPFTRVYYVSRFGKRNRTPRLTWAYGKVDKDIVTYEKRGYKLNLSAEVMLDWLNQIALYCREICKTTWSFDPGYNSAIIGKYCEGDDSIAFHTDAESFLATKFCANVTLGEPRDFQFRDDNGTIHEVKLQHKSLFFFDSLEHALPKRAKVKDSVRYSISFRNMATDIGIANSFYYCRGVNGAVDDDDKAKYVARLAELTK